MDSTQILQHLKELTLQHITRAEKLLELSDEQLNQKDNTEQWSVLECLEHLNLYFEFYLPEIQKRISASNLQSDKTFKSGWLGNYFAESMWPKEGFKKIKTFKDKNPIHSKLTKKSIEKFISHEGQLLELLSQIEHKNLNKIRCLVSISKLIKL